MLDWASLPQMTFRHIEAFEWWTTDGTKAGEVDALLMELPDELVDLLDQLEEEYDERLSRAVAADLSLEAGESTGAPSQVAQAAAAERDYRAYEWQEKEREAKQRSADESARRRAAILNAEAMARRDE